MSRGSSFYPPPRPCPDRDCRPWPQPCPPIWPQPCPQPRPCPEPRDDAAFRVKLFGEERGRCGCDMPPAAPPVTIVNPWNCRERAVVTLSVDECGNLVVCIKRCPPSCGC